MSATTSPSPPCPTAKSTLSRYVSRMRDALKTNPGVPRKSSPGPITHFTQSDYTSARMQSEWSRPTDKYLSASSPLSIPTVDLELDASTEESPDTTKPVIRLTTRTNFDYDRLRQIAEKWEIKLETTGPDCQQSTERVTKPIRMRVHRSCHRCSASFGSSKACPKCEHLRCTKCPRSPTVQTPSTTDRSQDRTVSVYRGHSSIVISAGRLVVDDGPDDEEVETLKRKYRYMLSLPSRSEGRELVRKKPMQRVRRTCHCCSTVFMPGSRTCMKCSHVRCASCPRDPPKRHKYPEGYPGDMPGESDRRPSTANSSESSFFNSSSVPRMGTMLPPAPTRVYKRPSRQLRYTCHGCRTIFSGIDLTCSNCGHVKCPECPRAPLKNSHSKIVNEPLSPSATPRQSVQQEVVEGVQERLKALEMDSQVGNELEVDDDAMAE